MYLHSLMHIEYNDLMGFVNDFYLAHILIKTLRKFYFLQVDSFWSQICIFTRCLKTDILWKN